MPYTISRGGRVVRAKGTVYGASPTALYRLYLGIADGMPVARVWACRFSKRVPARPYPRNRRAVGDADYRVWFWVWGTSSPAVRT